MLLRRAPSILALGGLILSLILTACGSVTSPIPTLSNVQMALTADFQTKNAPPPTSQVVQFPVIDQNIERLPHWHYQVSMSFEGIFADTQQPARGVVSADVFSNQIASERRVVLRLDGNLFGQTVSGKVEGVRLGNDFYFVDRNGVCSHANENASQRQTAELTAGSLVGGIREARFTTNRQPFGATFTWQYNFIPRDVLLPDIKQAQGGSIRIASGELWIASSLSVATLYTLTLDVTSAIIDLFQPDKQLTGRIIISYKLVSIEKQDSIPIPYGC